MNSPKTDGAPPLPPAWAVKTAEAIGLAQADGILHDDSWYLKIAQIVYDNAPVAAAPVAPELVKLIGELEGVKDFLDKDWRTQPLTVIVEAAIAALQNLGKDAQSPRVSPDLVERLRKMREAYVELWGRSALEELLAETIAALTAPAHQAALGGTQTEAPRLLAEIRAEGYKHEGDSTPDNFSYLRFTEACNNLQVILSRK